LAQETIEAEKLESERPRLAERDRRIPLIAFVAGFQAESDASRGTLDDLASDREPLE
jgi:hypothetical protein